MLQDSPLYAYLPANDLARARQFYQRTLRLRPAREIAGGVYYEFAGGTAAFLYESPNAGTPRRARRSGTSTTSSAKWRS